MWDHLEDAHVVLHAGDVVTGDLLDALRRRRPVHAVLGNNDAALVGALPDRLQLELAGVRIGMVHDSGPRMGRERRVHRWFPDAGLVVDSLGDPGAPPIEVLADPAGAKPGAYVALADLRACMGS